MLGGTGQRDTEWKWEGERLPVPQPTSSGYVPVNTSLGSEMFYVFYEAQQPANTASKTPIILWLQACNGKGGCLPTHVAHDRRLTTSPNAHARTCI
jgi:hypothetical protein